MHAGSNGRHNGAAKGATGIRKRRRHTRAILKEGLEAALRADPEVLEKCKPKTGIGLFIRGLVLEAAKCKATPLKTMMSLIDFEPEEYEDQDCEQLPYGDAWDWNADGEWQTMPEAEPASEPVEQDDGAAKKELKRRITRLIEAGQHEHAARIIDAIRSGYDPALQPISTA